MSETVYVINGRDTYHTKKNCCKSIAQSDKRFSEWDREMAEAWGKTYCKYCSGEYDAKYMGEQNYSYE